MLVSEYNFIRQIFPKRQCFKKIFPSQGRRSIKQRIINLIISDFQASRSAILITAKALRDVSEMALTLAVGLSFYEGSSLLSTRHAKINPYISKAKYIYSTSGKDLGLLDSKFGTESSE